MLFNGIQEEEGDENAKLFSHTSTNTSKRRTVPVQVQSIESLFSVLSGSQVRGSSFEELLYQVALSYSTMREVRQCLLNPPLLPNGNKTRLILTMAPQVHNGFAWEEVIAGAGNTAAQSPVQPVADGDGSIFVSIPSFRGKILQESLVYVLVSRIC